MWCWAYGWTVRSSYKQFQPVMKMFHHAWICNQQICLRAVSFQGCILMILHGCFFGRLFWHDLLNDFCCLRPLLDLLVMGLDFAWFVISVDHHCKTIIVAWFVRMICLIGLEFAWLGIACMTIIVLWFVCMRSLHDLLVVDFACSCLAPHFDSFVWLASHSSFFWRATFSGIKFDSVCLPKRRHWTMEKDAQGRMKLQNYSSLFSFLFDHRAVGRHLELPKIEAFLKLATHLYQLELRFPSEITMSMIFALVNYTERHMWRHAGQCLYSNFSNLKTEFKSCWQRCSTMPHVAQVPTCWSFRGDFMTKTLAFKNGCLPLSLLQIHLCQWNMFLISKIIITAV